MLGATAAAARPCLPATALSIRTRCQTIYPRAKAALVRLRIVGFLHGANVSIKTNAKEFTRQRTVVIDPGDRRQLWQVGCIRQHSRKRHPARKPAEENLIH